MHELGADGAGVGRLQAREQVAQLHPRLAGQAAGAELAVQVALGQVVELQAQVRRVHRRGQAQRIEPGAEVAARTVGGDQAADVALALVADGRRGRIAVVGGVAGGVGDVGDDRRVRDVTGLAALEPVEVGFPLRVYAVGGDQVLLVQVFDVGGVAAIELRGLRELLQEIVHDGDGVLWGSRGALAVHVAQCLGDMDENREIIPPCREGGVTGLD